jgi:hypothetical protein
MAGHAGLIIGVALGLHQLSSLPWQAWLQTREYCCCAMQHMLLQMHLLHSISHSRAALYAVSCGVAVYVDLIAPG